MKEKRTQATLESGCGVIRDSVVSDESEQELWISEESVCFFFRVVGSAYDVIFACP